MLLKEGIVLKLNLNDFDISQEEIELLLGEMELEKSLYYMLNFEKFKEKNSILTPTFNISALVFGPFWFAYRKMYVFSLIIFCINFIIGTITDVREVQLIVNIILSVAANRLYYEHLKIKCQRIKNKYDSSQVREQLEKQGGTSKLVLVLTVLYIGYFLIYLPMRTWNNILLDLYRKL